MFVAEDLRDGFYVYAVFNGDGCEAVAQLMGGGGDAGVVFIVGVERFKTSLCEGCFSAVGNNVVGGGAFEREKFFFQRGEEGDEARACFCFRFFYIRFVAVVGDGLCYVDQIGVEVDVTPLQGEDLTLAETGINCDLREEPGVIRSFYFFFVGSGGGGTAFRVGTVGHFERGAGVVHNISFCDCVVENTIYYYSLV